MKTISADNFDFKMVIGSSLGGYIKATYNQLVNVLGEPTCPNPSGDDKVQKEWVVKYKGEYFTIYDWKTYDVNYTMNELDHFHVGHKPSTTLRVYDFMEELQNKINEGN